MSTPRSVVIVGGGIVGLASALYAQRAGHRITVIERGARDHDGCSLGNAGMIVPSHFQPLAAPGMAWVGLRSMFTPRAPIHVRPRLNARLLRWGWHFLRSATPDRVTAAGPVLRDLALLSRRCYADLAAQGRVPFKFATHGLYVLCKTQHGLDEEAHVAALARELGLQADVLDAAQLNAREPGFTMDVAGGVYHAMDAHLTPQAFVAGVRAELEANGAQFLWSTEATAWRTDGARVTGLQCRGPDGVVEVGGEDYVLTAGAWTPATTAGLGLKLPIEAGKGYSLTLPSPPALPQACAILTEARIAITPMQGPAGPTLRFGGTMEFAGLNESIDPRRVEAMVASIPAYLPQFAPRHFAGIAPWRGLRPITPDGLPYIGRTQRWRNLVVASGHAMMGVSLAPATGQLVSEILDGRAPSLPLAPFAPERFG